MVWVRKVNTKSTVPGPQGPQGLPGVNAVSNDVATAGYIGTAGSSATKTALRQNGLTGWYHVEGNGVFADGVTDHTAELQEIFDLLPWGATAYFPEAGAWDKFIKISDTIEINRPCRVLGVPKDTYISSVRSDVPGLTFFRVNSAVVTFENVGIYGDATDDIGTGATQVGVHFRGTINGDIDALVKGSSFTRLETGVLIQGRNVQVENNLFSGTKFPTRAIGPDAVYHTGSNAADHRGHVIRLNRYHGCGAGGGAFAIVDNTTQLADFEWSNNYYDQIGGRGVVMVGTAAKPHNRVVLQGNRGTHLNANLYELTYVNQFTVRSESATGHLAGDFMVLNNCAIGEVSDVFGYQLGGNGVTARNCTRIHFDNVRFRQLGNSGTPAHGFDVDATNSRMSFDNITVDEYLGWGFTGSPTDSRFGRYSFRGTGGALGTINSTTFLPDQIFISAMEMMAGAGSPSLSGQAGGVQSVGWLMDAALTEQVSFQLPKIPVDWQYSISVLWAPTTAAGGGVSFQYLQTPLVPGAVAGSGQTGTAVVVGPAPTTANQVVSTPLLQFQTPVASPLQGRIIRIGGDAGDTYGADAAILGVLITRTR